MPVLDPEVMFPQLKGLWKGCPCHAILPDTLGGMGCRGLGPGPWLQRGAFLGHSCLHLKALHSLPQFILVLPLRMWTLTSCFAFPLLLPVGLMRTCTLGAKLRIHPSLQPSISLLTYSLRSKHLSLLFLSYLTIYPHKASLQILSCGPSHTS